jgi:hypothetical protein
VNLILAGLVVAAQTAYYEAKVPTFGCFSIAEVHELQHLRTNSKAFQMALITKQMQGQCVAIVKGTQVEGALESTDRSVLRVNERFDPPGYETPVADFAVKETPQQPPPQSDLQ